ncbi:MAG: hypothetical protein OER21_09410 [Gemmatimonadota bacterium]|nr:hypothetical protein [Gemmatimonadota bacterium]
MPHVPAPLADDPVAQRTRWDPLVGGGANFRTRDLIVVNASRLEFRASRGMKLFGGAFVALGLVAAGAGVAGPRWAPLLFGLAFAAIGVWLWFHGTAPVVFDTREGAFWRGRSAPSEAVNRQRLQHYAALGDIHALQLLAEHVADSDGSYNSYELNLVLTDGRRLNVTDHGDYDTLHRNTQTVSDFLNRPVWDTVAGTFGA